MREVSGAEAVVRAAAGGVVLVDVRERREWVLGHAEGAVHVPLGELCERVVALVPRDSRVLVYCATGSRSARAADMLAELGYPDVASVAGGLAAWVDAGGGLVD